MDMLEEHKKPPLYRRWSVCVTVSYMSLISFKRNVTRLRRRSISRL